MWRAEIRAITALEIVRHREVRQLFDRLRSAPQWSDRAIGLLRSNYQDGDDKLISEMLEDETDPDRLHIMCIDAVDVYRDNPVSDGMGPLLLVYEKGPCSTCRRTCIETIQAVGIVPEWMIEECLYDAYSETREFARRLRQDAGH